MTINPDTFRLLVTMTFVSGYTLSAFLHMAVFALIIVAGGAEKQGG